MLTPATQPEVQVFRHWLCTQVLEQADGGTAEPWAVPSLADLPAIDPGFVTEAPPK